MFIQANWWEFSEESAPQASEKIAQFMMEQYGNLEGSSFYQHKEISSNFISWHESSVQPTPLGSKVGEIEASFTAELKCDVGDANKSSQWLYIVHTDIPADIVDEYNHWNDEEHLPRLVTVPGVNRARRFICTGQSPRYLTAYSLDDPNAFESPEGLIARKTPWTAKMRSLFFNTRRTMAKKYEIS